MAVVVVVVVAGVLIAAVVGVLGGVRGKTAGDNALEARGRGLLAGVAGVVVGGADRASKTSRGVALGGERDGNGFG